MAGHRDRNIRRMVWSLRRTRRPIALGAARYPASDPPARTSLGEHVIGLQKALRPPIAHRRASLVACFPGAVDLAEHVIRRENEMIGEHHFVEFGTAR